MEQFALLSMLVCVRVEFEVRSPHCLLLANTHKVVVTYRANPQSQRPDDFKA